MKIVAKFKDGPLKGQTHKMDVQNGVFPKVIKTNSIKTKEYCDGCEQLQLGLFSKKATYIHYQKGNYYEKIF
jgi:hypothetical protein